MRKINKLAWLICTFLTLTNSLFARHLNGDSLRFSGKITDVDKQRLYDKISLSASKYDGFNTADSLLIYRSKIDINGNFNLKLPNLGKPYKLSIGIYSKEKRLLFNQVFYTEPKDDIRITIIQKGPHNSISFEGQGSLKYNVAARLMHQFYNSYFSELTSLKLDSVKDLSDLNLKMESLAILLKKQKAEKLRIIENSGLSNEMSEIINHEFGKYNNEWLFRTELMYLTHKYDQQVRENYLRYHMFFFDPPGKTGPNCPSYIKFVCLREAFELKLRTYSDHITINSLYETIKNNYSGSLREKLFGLVLLHGRLNGQYFPYPFATMDSLLKEACKIIRLPYIRKALNDKVDQMHKTNNTKVIDAEFLDTKGKMQSLASLRGKVVLIDTWFNGCFGCADFHKVFEKDIYPKFKYNKNFVVLSVNIDKENGRWLSGIKSNIYSSSNYINVTTGSWLDHPFFKYYKVVGSPWLMLIDAEGNVVYQPNGTSREEMKEKISEALNRMTAPSSK